MNLPFLTSDHTGSRAPNQTTYMVISAYSAKPSQLEADDGAAPPCLIVTRRSDLCDAVLQAGDRHVDYDDNVNGMHGLRLRS